MSHQHDQAPYDYIVVGAGSAGCIVAGRLAEAGKKVLLLEAGESAQANPETMDSNRYPDALANDRVMWSRFTTQQAHCNHRHLYAGTGTGMGGSGAVNGMVYTRGSREDYDQWPSEWHWDTVAPIFDQLEQRLRPHRRPPTRFTEVAVQAARETGFEISDDLNNGQLTNQFGYEWMNYDGHERRSSYMAFIKENQNIQSLTIHTQALAYKLLLDEQMVYGVEYEHHGQNKTACAHHEVILCLGTLETPKLLMLSGIGPSDHLKEMGVTVQYDHPQIGEHLHDHPNATLFYKGKHLADSAYPQLYGFKRINQQLPLPASQSDTCFVFYCAHATFREAMHRMLPAIALPPTLHEKANARKIVRYGIDLMFKSKKFTQQLENIYGIVVILGKPFSRGRVRLVSTNPRDSMAIDPNCYGDSRDLQTMLMGVRHARQIAQSQALTEWGNTALMPSNQAQNDTALLKWLYGATMTTFHFSGTCRMGLDASCPVTPDLKLKGIHGLRIADASTIPWVPVSATNAPSMLIGWRAADFILAGSTK